MATPSLAATGNRIKPCLHRLTLACYLLLIAISLIAIAKPAQASGTVASTTNTYFVWGNGFGNYVTAASPAEACGLADTDSQVTGPVITQVYSWRWQCTYTYRSDVGLPPSFWGTPYISFADYVSPTCPANTTTANPPCICADPYVPDTSQTRCILPACPVHASGTPPSCTCDAGYQSDPTRTSCVPQQYTLSLQTVSEMEPSDKTTDSWANVIATVVDAQGAGKSGVTVSINVDVVANSGGHNHDDGRHVSPYTGTLDTTTGTTGADGAVTFTFTAPEVSGTHIFTATCVQPTCTNSPATSQIDVKVDGLAPIPSSVFYRFISPNADTNHPDNHNLKPEASAKLATIAKAYYEATYLFKDGWIPNVMLNDASLKWGGILDCFLTCGNSVPWGPAHEEHRRGSVVDIRARLPAVNDPNNPLADTLLYEQEFKQAAQNAGVDPGKPHSSGNGRHYHLRLFGVKE